MKTIAYLGPESSYSFLAAQKAAQKDDVLIPLPTFPEVFTALRTHASDAAVIPIENSVEGNVNEVTDLLVFGNDDSAPVFINAEFVLKIENYLIAPKGTSINGIDTITTHWQPYAQCRQTLKKLLPNAKIAFADSTSAAVASLSPPNGRTAAVGGAQLITENLAALGPATVNDVEGNCTRFAWVSREDQPSPENNKLTVVFEAENRPGGLLRLLEIINVFGMNMTRIESRPHKSVLGRYVFIVDLNGNILDNDIASALELIKRSTVLYKYIGNYREL